MDEETEARVEQKSKKEHTQQVAELGLPSGQGLWLQPFTPKNSVGISTRPGFWGSWIMEPYARIVSAKSFFRVQPQGRKDEGRERKGSKGRRSPGQSWLLYLVTWSWGRCSKSRETPAPGQRFISWLLHIPCLGWLKPTALAG